MDSRIKQRIQQSMGLESAFIEDGIIVQGVDENEINEADVLKSKLMGDIEVQELKLTETEQDIQSLESFSNALSKCVSKSTPEVVHLVNAKLSSLENQYGTPKGYLTVGLESEDSADKATGEQVSKISSILESLKDVSLTILNNIGDLIDKLIGNVVKQVSGIRDKAIKEKQIINKNNVGNKFVKVTNRTNSILSSRDGLNGSNFINTFRETSDLFNTINNSYATEDGFKGFIDMLVESNSKDAVSDKTIKAIGQLTRDLDKLLVSSKVDGENNIRESRVIFADNKKGYSASHVQQIKPTRESINEGLLKLVDIYVETEKEEHVSNESFTISFENRFVDFLLGGARTWIGGAILYYGLTIVVPNMVTSFGGLMAGAAAGTSASLLIGGLLVGISYAAIIAIAIIVAKKLILSGSRQLVYSLEDNKGKEIDSKLIDFLVEYSSEYHISSGERYTENQPVKSLNHKEVETTLEFIIKDSESILKMCKTLKDRNKLIGNLKPVFKTLSTGDELQKQIYNLVEKTIKSKLKSHLNFEKDFLNSYSSVLTASLEYAVVSNGA